MSESNPSAAGPCAGCLGPVGADIGRRQFITAGMLAAASALLASCAADATGPGATISGGATIKVSDYPALAGTGGIATLRVGSTPIAIVNTGSGYLVLSRVCPHQGATVAQSGSGFRCPEHGATFSANGSWTGGQRTSSMRQLASSYDATSGVITLG